MGYTFTELEKKRIFDLVDKLVGTSKIASEKAEIFLNNIERRIYLTNTKSLEGYLNYASGDRLEHANLISSLTIHTTYWFREKSHFDLIQSYFKEEHQGGKIRALSLGCSTGEEVYSLALVFEKLRSEKPGFDYEIVGVDIDPISIEKARKAIYNARDLKKIPCYFALLHLSNPYLASCS